jgi:iron complex outermembrane recepter protein
MKRVSKKLLVNSLPLILLSGSTQFVWANQAVLPTIQLEATKQQTLADGKLNAEAQLGALGDKKIIDTPFTVTSYSNELIEQQQAKTIGAVLQNDASIRVTTNQGHLNENFKIRGFDVNHEDMSFNGLYAVSPYGRIPTELLDSVTVVKGPNAIVAGIAPSGSVGGVVIANSKRANKELTRLTTSIEKGGYYQSGIDVARRFGENNEFGVRVNGTYADGEHVVKGMNDKMSLGSIAADYTTEQLTLNFDAYAMRENRDHGSPAMVSMEKLTKVIQAPDGETNHFKNLSGRTNSQFAGVTGEYRFTPDLKAYAGVGYVEKEYAGHIFGTRMILQNENGDATSQYYNTNSKEHNVTANVGVEGIFNTGDIQHTVGLRTDYLTRKYTQHVKATQSDIFETNLYNPSNAEGMPAFPEVSPLEDDKFVSYTLTDQISAWDDKLQLILGARYQDMRMQNLRGDRVKYNEHKLSPSVGIVIKPFGEELSLYASYIEGLSKADSVTSTADVNEGKLFAPFETKQYELGAKFEKGSWFNTLALYQIEKPTLITSTLATAINKKTQITTDGGESRSRGIEWSFAGNITQNLNIMGGIAFIDAKYTKGSALINKKLTDISGNNIYGVPDFTASLNLDYTIPYIEGVNVNARTTYVSEQYLDNSNNLKLPDFALLDLGARYKTKLGGVDTTFLVNINNVTNKKYWEGVFNSNYAIIGAARTYTLGVTFDF